MPNLATSGERRQAAATLPHARAVLVTQRDRILELQRSLAAEEDALLEEHEADWQDRSATEKSARVMEAVGRLEFGRLTKIEAALARIDAGDYGYCRHCGEALDPNRLLARPDAEYCLPCAGESHP